jgi:hypothetical protein
VLRSISRLASWARRAPFEAALFGVYLLATLYVIGAPLVASPYPAMTDLPFHTAQAAVFRHYLDPSYHLQEQFGLQPFAVPYVLHYALGALFMLVLAPAAAMKLATGLLLALLPLGLSVLFAGLKKSPLLGVLGLGLVWCNLTHWGFISFVAALGLFALALGLALLVLDRPTRGRRVALSAALVVLFFTHVFRFPMALVAVLGAAVLLYPATRRLRPVLLPVLPSALLFLLWLRIRPASVAADFGPLALHFERFAELPKLIFGGLADPAEARAASDARGVLAVVALVGFVMAWLEGRVTRGIRRARAFSRAALAVAVCSVLGFLLLFLTLPMQAGDWWYIYPREAVSAVFLGLALMPDLPRPRWLRAASFGAMVAVVLPFATLTRASYAEFGASTEDFRAIAAELPKAPKLLYLVMDHSGTNRTSSPFLHLPAYVQAEKGGWLSFHFATWNAGPLRPRDASEPGAVVAPPVPKRWEWTPQLFDVRKHGPFFDWFLVRSRGPADRLFAADPTITRVDHIGTWWLYRRKVSR